MSEETRAENEADLRQSRKPSIIHPVIFEEISLGSGQIQSRAHHVAMVVFRVAARLRRCLPRSTLHVGGQRAPPPSNNVQQIPERRRIRFRTQLFFLCNELLRDSVIFRQALAEAEVAEIESSRRKVAVFQRVSIDTC